jgi:N-acetylmuramoyl-L-alanine amidase
MNRASRCTGWIFALAVSGALGAAAAPPPKTVGRAAPEAPVGRAEIRAAEQKLAELGYWTGSIDGVWDEVSRNAFLAFQKVEGRRRTGRLTRSELTALQAALPPSPRRDGPDHLEVDLTRQVLFLVDSTGRVGHVLPISSGSGKPFHVPGYVAAVAETPCGQFSVYSRMAGWRTSPLGEMFNPLYLVGGIAIHGSPSVPAFPASHGCIRVPMFAARTLPRIVAKDLPVFVYGCRDELAPPTEVAAAAR